jgi:hypothetical protein
MFRPVITVSINPFLLYVFYFILHYYSKRAKKIPPFASVSVSTVNGTVESGGVTVGGGGGGKTTKSSFLASVIPAPYRSRPTTLSKYF